MRVLITGSNGFIGKNLEVKLRERQDIEIYTFNQHSIAESLEQSIKVVDIVFHLAGANRPQDNEEFSRSNVALTAQICSLIQASGRKIPIIFSSSTQALSPTNEYGLSKQSAENLLKRFSDVNNSPVIVYQLPGIFGKWCRPNYNSVVATFCHNIANDDEIEIHNPKKIIHLLYIDDLIATFCELLDKKFNGFIYEKAGPEYSISIESLANLIREFEKNRWLLSIDNVGGGFKRALYSTYISYLPKSKFAYEIPCYADNRGSFIEILKTPDCGQISFFSANQGATRGGHYHHSKIEKFLVVRGSALFHFRNLLTDEIVQIEASDDLPRIIESIPGWIHSISNIGKTNLLVILWANEVFNPNNPDTIAHDI